ncbi:hypothetical protein ACFSO7_03120 [Bacillus sp. CGMCC 1.16607]|uniref:hypothetical protein n=1 Tax=Bacillus sp. CGMCC 1.16607 TaxID=3351842 RepID=UPI003631BF41
MDKKNSMPDFDSLDDRIIAEQPNQPMLVIKTNLDPKDPTENNPYFTSNNHTNKKAFQNYFDNRTPDSGNLENP